MNIIKVKNLSIENQCENISFSVMKNSFTNLVIPNNTDSEVVAKNLIGAEKNDAEIYIDDLKVSYEERKEVYKKVCLLLENPTATFLTNSVYEEIELILKSKKLKKSVIKRTIDAILEELEILYIKEKKPVELSSSEKRILSVALVLALEPKILILDKTLSKIHMRQRDNVISALKKRINKKQLTILNITSDMEDSIFSDYTLVLVGKKEIYKLDIEEIKKEKEILNSGLKLPFMVDLSIKLKYYDLLDKIILNKEELVNILWK